MDKIYLVRPLQVRDYLKYTGWSVHENSGFDEYIFWNPLYKREIHFPIDETDPGYLDSLEFLYSKIQSIRNISYRAIYEEITSIDSDMLMLRMITTGDEPKISLESAEKSISAIDKLLRASASTIRKPQINYKRMAFVESTRLLQETKLEQTAIGSFVLRISCPVRSMEDEAQLPLGLEDKSFVRLAFENVHDSTALVVRAIVSDQTDLLVEQMRNADTPSLSANFCDALALVAEASDRTSEMQFRWSPLISRPESKTIKISSEYTSRLQELSSRLRDENLVVEEVFVGTVERLDGQIGQDGRRSGEVILALFQSDETSAVRARADLNADQYILADEAHMSGDTFVRVKGKLSPGRQPRRLEVIEFSKVI